MVRRQPLMLGLALALALGCSRQAPLPPKIETPPAKVDSIGMEPWQKEILVGEATRISAFPVDVHGEDLDGREIRWSSSDEEVATVDEQGLAQGLSPGMATITATAEGIEGRMELAVIHPPVNRILIEPGEVEIFETRKLQLTAAATDIFGNPVVNRPIVWSSSEAGIVAVDAEGLLEALAPGEATITAAVGGMEASIQIVVLAIPVESVVVDREAVELFQGRPLQLHAYASDEEGIAIPGKVIGWSSSDPAIVEVDAQGLLQPLAPGEATITASFEDKRTEVEVVVLFLPVARVRMNPPTLSIEVERSAVLEAVALDSDELPIEDRMIEWRTSDLSIASVDAGGIVRGLRPGQATITAAIEAKTASSFVVVRPAVSVARVELDLGEPNLLLGESRKLRTRVLDEEGNEIEGWQVSWTSSDLKVLVQNQDRLQAVGAGRATIRATAGERWAEETFSVEELRFGQIAVGGATSCALSPEGRVYCWGSFPPGAPTGSRLPQLVESGIAFRQLSVGSVHLCGLTAGGAAYCLGSNEAGQLGTGTYEPSLTFVAVAGGHRFRDISAGSYYSCAITVDDQGYCWGANDGGNLGVAEDLAQSPVPLPVDGGLSFRRIATSGGAGATTCGITLDHETWCWGENESGQLGDGTTRLSRLPARVVGGHDFTSISTDTSYGGRPQAIAGHSCAANREGVAFCWGANLGGELGTQGGSAPDGPVQVLSSQRFSEVHVHRESMGRAYSCGITLEKRAMCWGQNGQYQLGIGSNLQAIRPAFVLGGLLFSDLGLGTSHACGITVDGQVYCWGTGYGVGSDSIEPATIPTLVVGQGSEPAPGQGAAR